MNKFMEFLENMLLPIADKLNNNRYLTALRDGFMVALPLIIFGSIFVVIANFPFLDKLLGKMPILPIKMHWDRHLLQHLVLWGSLLS